MKKTEVKTPIPSIRNGKDTHFLNKTQFYLEYYSIWLSFFEGGES